jgi:twitching motility two-component system response regulator PilH
MDGSTILVVEDSPTALALTTTALQARGFRVVTAVDGEEALRKAAAERPVLVLLDVILPKKNGFQVCRELKSGLATRDIKVVLVTSKTQESDRFWGLKQGADDYLTKPFKEEDLLAVVQRQL